MKKILSVLFAVLAFAGQAVFAADDDDNIDVAKLLASGKYEIIIDVAFPQGGPSVQTSGDYSIIVKNGKATGTLPFFGTSYSAMYGSDKSSVEFDGEKLSFKKSAKDKEVQFEASFKINSQPRWTGTIAVWDNGAVDIMCSCSTKSPMTYRGELVELRDDKE